MSTNNVQLQSEPKAQPVKQDMDTITIESQVVLAINNLQNRQNIVVKRYTDLLGDYHNLKEEYSNLKLKLKNLSS
jgi:hypothetical protein